MLYEVDHTIVPSLTILIKLIKCLDTTMQALVGCVLRHMKLIILWYLHRLIYVSSLAYVPPVWKHANVIPLLEKGDSSESNNNWPVSFLSCSHKILERIVCKKVCNYIKDNDILSPDQLGLQPYDSAVNQLAYLYHIFYQALDAKKDEKLGFLLISQKCLTEFGVKA